MRNVGFCPTTPKEYDLGVLLLAQLLAEVQHNRGALVRHAKLVGVHRHTGHPLYNEVKGGGGWGTPACRQRAGQSPPNRRPHAATGCTSLSPAHRIDNVMQDNM